ncbi:MAG: AsnC family transcriptional regulator [Sulfolobales archaeon]
MRRGSKFLDEIDLKLLRILQENPRASLREISKKARSPKSHSTLQT